MARAPRNPAVEKLHRRATVEARAGKMDLMNAVILLDEKDYEGAIEAAEKALKGTRMDLLLFQFMAFCYNELGLSHKTLLMLRKALHMAPEDTDIWKDLALQEVQVACEEGRFQEGVDLAQGHLGRAEALGEVDLQFCLLQMLSDAFSALRRSSDAVDARQRALALKPGDVESRLRVVAAQMNVAMDQGDNSALEKLSGRAILLCKSPEVEQTADMFHRTRARALRKLGRLEEALEEATVLVRVAPRDKRNFKELSEVCAALGRHKEALRTQERVVELDPWDSSAQLVLAERRKAAGVRGGVKIEEVGEGSDSAASSRESDEEGEEGSEETGMGGSEEESDSGSDDESMEESDGGDGE